MFQIFFCNGNFIICVNKYNKQTGAQMNILSNEQMREKELGLLDLYSQSEIKLKIDLEELIEVKSKKRNLFCLRKLEENTRVWIQKLVPLSRRIQCINLQEEQNGLFKALTFIFLFIIYKPRDHSHQYLKQHIKCSLYSSDIDLLEIKNHSFNKRMRSDVIKSVMATFMKELDEIVHSDLVTRHRFRVEDLLGYLLQKNDIIVEGFHLFYRSILCKLQVQNANNCIQQVGVQQAIQNLLSYLQIDCRQFSNLYLFNEANMFMAILQQQLIFGRYYENQTLFQQTSEQQLQDVKELGEVQHEEKNRFAITPLNQLNKDLKMFNFALDSDRNQSCQEEYFEMRSNEATTPCFVGNEEMRFGRKKSLESNGEMHASFNKFKDRLVSEKIHQIQSQEEDFQNEKRQSGQFGQVHDKRKNKFLNLEEAEDSDHFQEEDDNMAPTPMLGGTEMFHFGLKPPPNQKPQPKSPAPSISPKNSQNHQPLTQTKQLISTAIRRQSYQGDNSSQSKSSDNRKKQMKTSKNQIKVIDQTASRVSLVKISEDTPRKANFPAEEDFVVERKFTMNECEKVSSYSNCMCHVEKRAKIKLNSNTVEVNIQQTVQVQRYPPVPPRKISQDSMDFVGIKKQPLSYENKAFFFKSNANKSTDDLLKGEDRKNKSPVKQPKDQHKRQQFINFLKKDKTELIKKLTQKRHAKNNVTSGQLPSSKADQNKTTQATRKFVKQSMFVGSYNFQNPQKLGQGKNDGSRPVTHGRSMEKQIGVRQRSKTPTQPKLANPFQPIKAPTPYPQQSRKQSTQISTAVNFKSNCVTMQQNPQPPIPKPQITFKVPLQSSQPPAQQNIQWISPQNNIKPYEFYLKRDK